MASPQKEKGFTPIANEILEEISKLKLNGTQFRILLIIWRYTYGFSRKECSLSETFISKAIGCHRIRLNREINKLIQSRIVDVMMDATFTTPRILSFNKNYSEWLQDNSELTEVSTVSENVTSTVSENVTSTVSENVTQERKNINKNIKESNKEKEAKVNYQIIADMYNEICISFPRLTKLSDARKKTIKARLKQYSIDDFKNLFSLAESSKFLKGGNDRNWSATFDWLIKDANMVKVLDGNYNRKEKGVDNATRGIHGETDKSFAERAIEKGYQPKDHGSMPFV